MEASHYGEHKHPTLLPFLLPDKDHWEGEREQTAHQPPVFLINIVPVVRLCLIMHDCYQQQTPLNEAPLKGNTIIPPGAQEERQNCFSSPSSPLLLCDVFRASRCVEVKVQSATQNGHGED